MAVQWSNQSADDRSITPRQAARIHISRPAGSPISICNSQIGGYTFMSCGGWWITSSELIEIADGFLAFIVEIPMWPPLSAAQPRLQDQLGDLVWSH